MADEEEKKPDSGKVTLSGERVNCLNYICPGSFLLVIFSGPDYNICHD